MTNPLVVNPTSCDAATLIIKVAEKTPYLDHFNSVTVDINGQNQDVAFTLPIFVFTKPVRESKKLPGTMKPEGRYCAVYEPKALGVGSFAGVYPIKGTWKIENGTATFKTKKPGTPERLVKSDPDWEIYPNDNKQPNAFKTFVDEQKIGYWAEYMGYKYAPLYARNRAFLLMNRQPGVSLQSIIEELQKNPDFLSITQKLQITVGLLKEAQLMLHHDRIPTEFSTDLAHIVHRDLKPDNTIVDLGPPVVIRYIDFGLAKRSDKLCHSISGTPLYLEPQLFEHLTYSPQGRQNADKISDTFSIARIIAELWGDTSRDSVNTPSQLRDQNKHIPLTGLLSGITGLTANEDTQLRVTIGKMNQYAPQTRLSEDRALNVFEKLLADRLKIEDQIMAINIMRPIENLSDKELLNMLRSVQYEPVLLQKLQNSPDTVRHLVSTLNLNLASLSEATLEQLKAVGMDLSTSALIETGLSSGRLSPAQVNLLARFGAPVPGHLLENHLKLTVNDTNWIAMCRTLYHLTDNSEAILQKTTYTSAFNRLYCKHFLKLNAPDLDSYHNHLNRRHLSLINTRNFMITESRRILTTLFPDSPELNVLLSSELLDTASDQLYLMKSTDLNNLYSNLCKLEQISGSLERIKSGQERPNRHTEVTRLKSQLAQISLNNRNEWEKRISTLEFEMKQFMEFDRLADQVRNYVRDIGWALTEMEFDAYYAEINNTSLQKLRDQRDLISAASSNIRAIRHQQRALSNWGLSTSINTMFADALASCTLGDVNKLADTATLYMNLYAEFMQNLKNINSSQFQTLFMPQNQADFYKRLKNYFQDNAHHSDINSLKDVMKSMGAFLSMNHAINLLVIDKLNNLSEVSKTSLIQYLYQHSEGDMKPFMDGFVSKSTHILQNDLIDPDFCLRFNDFNHLVQRGTIPLPDNCKEEFFNAITHYLSDPIEGNVGKHKTIWRQKLDMIVLGINPSTQTTQLSPFEQTFFNSASISRNHGSVSYGQYKKGYW